jgi:hypothetical protein
MLHGMGGTKTKCQLVWVFPSLHTLCRNSVLGILGLGVYGCAGGDDHAWGRSEVRAGDGEGECSCREVCPAFIFDRMLGVIFFSLFFFRGGMCSWMRRCR